MTYKAENENWPVIAEPIELGVINSFVGKKTIYRATNSRIVLNIIHYLLLIKHN